MRASFSISLLRHLQEDCQLFFLGVGNSIDCIVSIHVCVALHSLDHMQHSVRMIRTAYIDENRLSLLHRLPQQDRPFSPLGELIQRLETCRSSRTA